MLGGAEIRRAKMDEDRACTNKECGHPFSSHNGRLRDASTMEGDSALASKTGGGDIHSSRPIGESACSEGGCPCRAYRQ